MWYSTSITKCIDLVTTSKNRFIRLKRDSNFIQIRDNASDIFLFITPLSRLNIRLFFIFICERCLDHIHSCNQFFVIVMRLLVILPPFYFVQTPELLLHVFPCHLTFILFSFKGVDIKTCTYISNLDTNIITTTRINTTVLVQWDLMVQNVL